MAKKITRPKSGKTTSDAKPAKVVKKTPAAKKITPLAARQTKTRTTEKNKTLATTQNIKAAHAKPPIVNGSAPAPDILMAQAQAAISAAIENLNTQMNQAVTALTTLAAAGDNHARPIVRTAPLDRTTAMFQRLVSEMLDDHLAELLPPLITLRGDLADEQDARQPQNNNEHSHQNNEPSQQNNATAQNNSDENDYTRQLCARGVDILDHVLKLAGVQSYHPREGEPFDPLIHLAVGDTNRQDIPDASVSQTLQPGFRSARGKVLVPAKVRVNRR